MTNACCSSTRTVAGQFAFWSAIPLFYLAILNFKRQFDHEKVLYWKNELTFCPGIQDINTKLDKICDLGFFLFKTVRWRSIWHENIFVQIFNELKRFEKYLQRGNWWPQCKEFHMSLFWSDFIFKDSFGILNIKARKLSSSLFQCYHFSWSNYHLNFKLLA